VVQQPISSEIDQSTFEIESQDLELLESRINEIEKYLGIEDIDMTYFSSHKEDDLKKRTQYLEEFVFGVEDKVICMDQLYQKFIKMESFLKHNEPFSSQCMDLKHKSNFVLE